MFALVRNKADTEAKIASWNKTNIHVIQADVTDYDSLKRAADTTAGITGGSLDHIIANAAYLPHWPAFDPMSVL